MIISHRHKFIFIKTKKTAGTSIELALRQICGPEDVITPVLEDEDGPHEGRGPQHWKVGNDPRDRMPVWLKKIVPRTTHHNFAPHIPARDARRLIGPEIWDSYFKFTVERNPWDRQVSHYFYQIRPETGNDMTFGQFMQSRRAYLDNYEIYTIDDRIVADHVIRFERLASEFDETLKRLGITQTVTLPRAKDGIRKVKAHYREFYDDRTRDLVARWYAPEIEAFGYEF